MNRIMEEPIILLNHPKKGVIIEGRPCRHGHDISETKDCTECQHLKAITSTKKTGYRLTEERLLSIYGVCTWSYWRIIWRTDKPKKCVKLSKFFQDQYTEQERQTNRQ